MATLNKKIGGTETRPRANVFRSNSEIYIQAIDDLKGNTLFAASSIEIKEKVEPIKKAEATGKLFAKKAKDKKIQSIIFDRNGYKYHGQVKALADGIREGGLIF